MKREVLTVKVFVAGTGEPTAFCPCNPYPKIVAPKSDLDTDFTEGTVSGSEKRSPITTV